MPPDCPRTIRTRSLVSWLHSVARNPRVSTPLTPTPTLRPQEWLASGSMLRQIYDLSSLEREDGGGLAPSPKAGDRTTLNL